MQAFFFLVLLFALGSCRPSLTSPKPIIFSTSDLIQRDPSSSSPERNAYVRLVIRLPAGNEPGTMGGSHLDSHASIEFQGDGTTDGNFRVQIAIANSVRGVGYVVVGTDFGTNNPMVAPLSNTVYKGGTDGGVITRVYPLDGTVQLSNDQLLDSSGNGLIKDLWAENPNYDLKMNSGNRFVTKIVTRLGLKMSDDLLLALANADALYQTYNGDYRQSSAPLRLIKFHGANYQSKEGWDFDVSDPTNPELLTHLEPGDPSPPVDRSKPGLLAKSMKYKLQFDSSTLPTIDEGIEPPDAKLVGSLSPSDALSAVGTIPDVEIEDGATTALISSSQGCPVYTGDDNGHFVLLDDAITTTAPLPEAGPPDSAHLVAGSYDPETNIGVNTACRLIARSHGVGRRGLCENYSNKIPGESTDLVIARTQGETKLIASLSTGVLEGLGAAAAVLSGALFVLLDYVEGDWKQATFALAGLGLGVGLDLAIAGPIGAAVGLAAVLLFSILPGIFDRKEPPKSNNLTQIVQYAFFGDKDHTGNEGSCSNKTTSNTSQNCTVLYGAGVISKVFDWNIFDAVAFLIRFNEGNSMSIPDIASVFNVTDYSVPGWGSNVTATVDCGRQTVIDSTRFGDSTLGGGRTPGKRGVTYYSPKSGYQCGSPKFKLNRTLITIPEIDDTADNVYNRIVPNPGGDCKLLSDPSEKAAFPFLNMTVTGQPVAIVCNLTQGTGIDPNTNYYNSTAGTGNSTSEYPLTNTTTWGNSTNSTIAPVTGISSDDSTDRAYEAAPPPQSFKNYTAADSICVTSPTGMFCFPNGTYTTQQGSLGFSTSKATALAMPVGSHLDITVASIELPDLIPGYPTGTYGTGSDFSIGDQEYNTTTPFFNNITGATSSNDGGFRNLITFITSQKADFDVHVPGTSPPGVCIYTEKNYCGDVECFGVGGGNFTNSIGSRAQSINLKGSAVAWIYPFEYDDHFGHEILADTEDLTGVAYGTDSSYANNIKALWVKPSI